jgi:hypothetical protein
MNDVVVKNENSVDVLVDLQHTEKVVSALLNSKHYAKMGPDGVYAIVQKAKSMGINPLDALNGGVYYVQGKVEMSSQMMNRLIRSKGHSIQKDEKSTKTCCILHGRRADNGDKWSVSFSVEDAKKAGIFKSNGPWEKYTEAMCFARALSMLARQLFPDVIVDCYVQGEISDAPSLMSPVEEEKISNDHVEAISALIDCDEKPEEIKQIILGRLSISCLEDIQLRRFEGIVSWAKKRQEDQKNQKKAISIEIPHQEEDHEVYAEEMSAISN